MGRLCYGVGTGKMVWEKEWNEPIISMQSNLKTYQRIEFKKYATHQLSVKSDQKGKTQIVQGSQSVEQMSAIQGMYAPTQHPWNYSNL